MAPYAYPAWEFSLFVLGLLVGHGLPILDQVGITLFVFAALYVLARTEHRYLDIRQQQLARLERCETHLAVVAEVLTERSRSII